MSEDNLYLLSCYIILGITILFSTYRKNQVFKIISIHLLISIVYSSYFLYNMRFNGSGGSSLVWLVYLMVIVLFHTGVNSIFILIHIFKKKF